MPDEDQPTFARRTIARASAGSLLTVVVVDDRGRRRAAPGLAAWLRRVAPARARGAVTVALVTDRRMRALNRAYRRKDHATDVLSFPGTRQGSARSRASERTSPKRRRRGGGPNPLAFLGDIVIARGIASRQARQAGHDERTELRILALHGLLHLLGYDHERDNGRMLRVERRLRKKGGVREGLIERTRQSAVSGHK